MEKIALIEESAINMIYTAHKCNSVFKWKICFYSLQQFALCGFWFVSWIQPMIFLAG